MNKGDDSPKKDPVPSLKSLEKKEKERREKRKKRRSRKVVHHQTLDDLLIFTG